MDTRTKCYMCDSPKIWEQWKSRFYCKDCWRKLVFVLTGRAYANDGLEGKRDD